MTETVSSAVTKRDNSPAALVKTWRAEFESILPSHIDGDTWVRVTQGALKKGRKTGNKFDLEIAAENNPQAFLQAIRDAARLGLQPGTEEFYLTPRKVKGRPEILGIVGYQGIVELMYRAGAISSVIAECVYTNDKFTYLPGQDERPRHEIDWDAPDRGRLRLVYAFARMKDGATSKVVVLNRQAIDIIKKSAQGADSDYSPWTTNEAAMWMKSAVRQLAKWVPTSSEFRRELRVDMAAAAQADGHDVYIGREIDDAIETASKPVIDVSHLSEMRDDDPDLLSLDADVVDDRK